MCTARQGRSIGSQSAPQSGNLICSTGFIAAMTHFLLRIIKLSFYLNLSPSERKRKIKKRTALSSLLKGCWRTAINGDSVHHSGITVTGNKQTQTGSLG